MEHVRQLTDLVQQRERTKRDVTTRCAQTAFWSSRSRDRTVLLQPIGVDAA